MTIRSNTNGTEWGMGELISSIAGNAGEIPSPA